MMAKADPDEALRQAFVAGADVAGGGTPGDERDDCPSPERLWAAAAEELPVAERRAIVDHTSRCAACAEDFRVVAALVHQSPAYQAAALARKPAFDPIGWLEGFFRKLMAPTYRPAWAAIALVLVAGVVISYQRRLDPDEPPVYRGAEDAEIVSLLEAAPRLPRQAALLRWKGPEGARFELTITTAELRKVHQALDLEQNTYQVPEEVLTSIPDGSRLLWRVEAVLPDGRRVSSSTFDFELKDAQR